MTDITIPPAVLEAGARAIYFAFTEVNIGDGEDRWDRLLPRYRAEYREQARAAFLAIVEAWPGMKLTPWWEFTTHKMPASPALRSTSTLRKDTGCDDR